MNRKTQINLVIIACFAVGLGAALTPVGEPLSTIVIKTKLQEDFWYLFRQIGIYIIPGIIGFGIVSMFFVGKKQKSEVLTPEEERETLKDVGIRAFKVYVFVMALVFLVIGFIPIAEWYIKFLVPQMLYALMGLLIAGGMLIPGNIPNIIVANKLRITSKEWAKLGVTLEALIMVVYFVILFALKI